MIQVIFFFKDKGAYAWMMRLVTGCKAYHAAFLDVPNGVIYEMNLLRRKRKYVYNPEKPELRFWAPPAVTREYLEEQLLTDRSKYGFKDYVLFLFRPLYHLVGKSTRNRGGVICSEMVNYDIWKAADAWDKHWNDGPTPWHPVIHAPPSPCQLVKWASTALLEVPTTDPIPD